MMDTLFRTEKMSISCDFITEPQIFIKPVIVRIQNLDDALKMPCNIKLLKKS